MMLKCLYKTFEFLNQWIKAIMLVTTMVACFSVPIWGKSIEDHDRTYMIRGQQCSLEIAPPQRLASNSPPQKRGTSKDRSTEDKTRLRNNIQQWKSLPPEEQNILRQRMNQWKKLPSEDRNLYQKRFKQLRKLSPQERQSIQKKLKKWDSLPPQEKEKIRQRFRNPDGS